MRLVLLNGVLVVSGAFVLKSEVAANDRPPSRSETEAASMRKSAPAAGVNFFILYKAASLRTASEGETLPGGVDGTLQAGEVAVIVYHNVGGGFGGFAIGRGGEAGIDFGVREATSLEAATSKLG